MYIHSMFRVYAYSYLSSFHHIAVLSHAALAGALLYPAVLPAGLTNI